MTYTESLDWYRNQVAYHIPQNPFERKEQIGRRYFQWLEERVDDIILLSGTSIQDKLHYDVLVQLCDHCDYLVGEIKVRNASITSYDEWMLEEYKLNKLQVICEELNQGREAQGKPLFIPALINVTSNDGILSIYDLSVKAAKQDTRNCRRNNQSWSRKPKQVSYYNHQHLITQYHLNKL